MIEGSLIALAAMASIANLVYGSVLVWGLSGGDGEGSLIGGILGLALFAALLWVSIQSMSLLEPVFRAVTIGFLVVGAGAAMHVLGATDDRHRRLLMGFSVGVSALVVVVAVGIGRGGLIEGWRPVLIALVPPFLLLVASAVVDIGSSDGERGTPVLVTSILASPAILLTLAHVV